MTYEDCGDDYGDLLIKSLQDCVNIPFGVYKQAKKSSAPACAADFSHQRDRKRSWTELETDLLKICVEQHENDWRGAAEQVSKLGTPRTPQQCQQHWRRVVNPQLIKGRWRKEEDQLLTELCRKEDDILKISAMMKSRSYVQVRNRMVLLKLGRFGAEGGRAASCATQ